MLIEIDDIRIEATKKLDQSKRGELGQFMTPSPVAQFMASLFNYENNANIHLLDAGAGIGSLSVAFLDWFSRNKKINTSAKITAFEVDNLLIKYLTSNLYEYKKIFSDNELIIELINSDFILDSVLKLKSGKRGDYTHAILNPPYKKINSTTNHRKLLSFIGFETVNLYSAFIGLAIMLLKDKGELVAIIPRSFCNGNYYKTFRRVILENTTIQQIHLFESRTHAFKDDEVLQENIIVHLIKGAKQGQVKISKSKCSKFEDYEEENFAFQQIVKEEDKEYFIHIPSSDENQIVDSNSIIYSLSDLGVEVSTGPIVDFRSKEYIFMEPNENTVPLIYPTHFNCKEIQWPKQGKKPNAIELNNETLKLFYPSGFYTVVKRFSSKEEKQRIVARVINPEMLNFPYFGLENHLNVFHYKKKGIDKDLAYGIATYLNSSYVDKYFRSFNGHTQVNATDLKQMKYPKREILINLGKWASGIASFDQSIIDNKILLLL